MLHAHTPSHSSFGARGVRSAALAPACRLHGWWTKTETTRQSFQRSWWACAPWTARWAPANGWPRAWCGLGCKASTQLTCYSMGLSAQPFILDVGALHSVHLIQSTTWTALLPRAPQCGQSSRAPSRSVFTTHWMPLFSVTAWATSLQKLQDLRAGDRGDQTAAQFPVHHTVPACAGASRRDRAWSGSLIDEQCVQLRRTNLCHCRFCASCIGLWTIGLHYHINRAGSKRCPPPAGKVEAYAGHLQAPFVIW